MKKGMKLKERPKKGIMLTYIILRLLVVVVMIAQIYNHNWANVFTCILTLFLFMVPLFFEKRLKIDVPDTLEIIILLFIFSAEILGEIQEYYLIFEHWDTILHTMNGFLCGAIGLSLIDILNRSDKIHMSMSPNFVAMVAFCFSMTVGVMWEFFEWSMDLFFGKDMQKDTWIYAFNSVALNPYGINVPAHLEIDNVIVNGQQWPGYLDIGLHDTMKDLLVNFIGAATFAIIGRFLLINQKGEDLAKRFILKLMSED